MILGQYWKLHDDDTLRRLDDAAIRLLAKSGCRINHEGLLAMLEGAGCRIVRSESRCYFPESLVREAVAHLGGKTSEQVAIPTGWNPQHHLVHLGSNPHLLEWPSAERRLATKEDIAKMAKMAHVLDHFTCVGRVLTCAEVDHRIEPLWTTLRLAEITDKPIGGGEVFHAHHIEPLVRMGEVLTGIPNDTSLIAACDFFTAPLTFDRAQAECFLTKRHFGLPNYPGTMPISGLSAPVTIAGAVAVAVAELLAGWVMGYVVNPDLPAGGIVASGSLDMRSASACFGSPEALLQDVAVVQLCRRLYGISVDAATGYVDCKVPGLDAVFQKMFPLVAGPFGVLRGLPCDGLLSAGQDYSPVQQLLEAEVQAAISRFWGGFAVSDDTIAAELIEQVCAGQLGDFLNTDHTLRHFRGEQWYPEWFERGLWRGAEIEADSDRRLLERIAAEVKSAIERYQPPDLDQSKLTELRRIYAAAERALVGVGSGG